MHVFHSIEISSKKVYVYIFSASQRKGVQAMQAPMNSFDYLLTILFQKELDSPWYQAFAITVAILKPPWTS